MRLEKYPVLKKVFDHLTKDNGTCSSDEYIDRAYYEHLRTSYTPQRFMFFCGHIVYYIFPDGNHLYAMGMVKHPFDGFCGGTLIGKISVYRSSLTHPASSEEYVDTQEHIVNLDDYDVACRHFPDMLRTYIEQASTMFFLGDSAELYNRVSGSAPMFQASQLFYRHSSMSYDPTEIDFEGHMIEDAEYNVSIPVLPLVQDCMEELKKTFDVGITYSKETSNHGHDVVGIVIGKL